MTFRTRSGRPGKVLQIVGPFACALFAIACFETGDLDDPNRSSAPSCPARVRDTLGTEYPLDCDDPDEALAASVAPPTGCSETLFFALHPSRRLLRVCLFEGDPHGGSSVSAGDCRPIACSSRADCGGYTCLNGVCQMPNMPVLGEDALVLCLADIAWPTSCSKLPSDPKLPALFDALEACLEDDEAPCQVPSICKQP